VPWYTKLASPLRKSSALPTLIGTVATRPYACVVLQAVLVDSSLYSSELGSQRNVTFQKIAPQAGPALDCQ